MQNIHGSIFIHLSRWLIARTEVRLSTFRIEQVNI